MTDIINTPVPTPSALAAIRERLVAQATEPEVALKPAQLVRAAAVGAVFDEVSESLAADDRYDIGEILAHLSGWVLFGSRYDPYEETELLD